MRAKMDRANRAKQFMPFSALIGLESALQEKERPPFERILLGEDAQQEMDRLLQSLSIGTAVCAVYDAGDGYVECRGPFRGKDDTDGCLRIGRERIPAESLLHIELC